MSHHPTTRAYVVRQRAPGRRTPQLIPMLQQAIAREIYRTLARPTPVPDITDLGPARQTRLLSLAVVADHFGVWPATISRLERGLLRDDTLADQYRAWLAAA